MLFLEKTFIQNAVTSKTDDSGQSVGRRYARTDECGIPFAITVDEKTLEDNTVTMRQLDTMKQIRLPIAEAAQTINALRFGQLSWPQAVEKYGLVNTGADE